jgi:hypothetical protein
MKNFMKFKKMDVVDSNSLNRFGFIYNTTNRFIHGTRRILLILCVLFYLESALGQGLPPSNPPDLPQRGKDVGNQNPAPIGDGTFYLVCFMLVYIGVKIRQANKKALLGEGENEK